MSTKKMDRIDCRINLSVKDLAKDVCEDLGMSLTEAVTLFLHQLILQNGLPFEVKLTSRDRKFFQRMKESVELEDNLVEVPVEAPVEAKPAESSGTETEEKAEPESKAEPENDPASEHKAKPVLLADFPELSGMEMSELTEDAEIAELGDGDLMDSEELLQ